MQPPISLCIINFNGEAHLERLYRGLEPLADQFAEVLLIDNASTDDSLSVTKKLCPKARVICLPKNLGPGAARNAGFRQASHDLVLFLDNDIQLHADTAGHLLRLMIEVPNALLVTPRVVYADDPMTVQYDSADCHFLGLMATRNADRPVSALGSDSCRTTSMVSACFLINRDQWKHGELFDESFGFNLEDHDFGVRACVTGHALWSQPQAVVLHGSGTPGLSYRPGETASKKRYYCLTLNRWIIVTQYFERRTLILLTPTLLLFEFMQFAWLASQGHSRVWLRAIRSYASNRERTLKRRREFQKLRCVADSDILREAALPLTGSVRRGSVSRALIDTADRLMVAYWHLIRRWL